MSRRVTIRHVWGEARARLDRGGTYPSCRNQQDIVPAWCIQYSPGPYFYYCDGCLPAKYRQVADSMLRGNEQERIIVGAAPDRPDEPPARRPEPGSSRIPWRQLL